MTAGTPEQVDRQCNDESATDGREGPRNVPLAAQRSLLATAEWGTNLTIVSPVVMEWGRRRA